MASAYGQFRSRCIQKMIAGAAIGIIGLVLVFAEISIGAVTIQQSTWLGAAIAVAGLLYAAAAGMAWRGRTKPAVRR